jgi:hypothetical protein
MKNVNLFPYRQQRQWCLIRSFQKAVIATSMFSFVVAALLAWAFGQREAWSGLPYHAVSQVRDTLPSEQLELVEQLYHHIQSTQLIQEERQQRLKLLRFIHALAQDTMQGVWVQQLQWSEEVLLMDAWSPSDEQVQAWVQRLQRVAGVSGIQILPADADARAKAMSMDVVRFQIHLRGEHVQP